MFNVVEKRGEGQREVRDRGEERWGQGRGEMGSGERRDKIDQDIHVCTLEKNCSKYF